MLLNQQNTLSKHFNILVFFFLFFFARNICRHASVLLNVCVSVFLSTRPPIYCNTTREHYSEHFAGRLLYLSGGGLPSQPNLHLVLGGGQCLLQEVKLWTALLLCIHLSGHSVYQLLSRVLCDVALWWIFPKEEWYKFKYKHKSTWWGSTNCVQDTVYVQRVESGSHVVKCQCFELVDWAAWKIESVSIQCWNEAQQSIII